MRNVLLVAILILAGVCFSAGLLHVPGNGPCPGGTHPTVYTGCTRDWHCPRGQYCFLENPLTGSGFCCPYPPKPYY